MDTSLNPCLCKDLYGYLMELCLGLGFSYLLVSIRPGKEISHKKKKLLNPMRNASLYISCIVIIMTLYTITI